MCLFFSQSITWMNQGCWEQPENQQTQRPSRTGVWHLCCRLRNPVRGFHPGRMAAAVQAKVQWETSLTGLASGSPPRSGGALAPDSSFQHSGPEASQAVGGCDAWRWDSQAGVGSTRHRDPVRGFHSGISARGSVRGSGMQGCGSLQVLSDWRLRQAGLVHHRGAWVGCSGARCAPLLCSRHSALYCSRQPLIKAPALISSTQLSCAVFFRSAELAGAVHGAEVPPQFLAAPLERTSG